MNDKDSRALVFLSFTESVSFVLIKTTLSTEHYLNLRDR